MKKKITFKDACAIWLDQQRKQNNLETSNINNALRVSYFACFVNDDVTTLTGDAVNAIWDAFEVRWLGNEAELRFASSYLKLCLIHIGQILNDHNSGKKKMELPDGWEYRGKKQGRPQKGKE